MNPAGAPRDLVVLAADADAHRVLEAILKTPDRLGIRPVTFAIERHPGHDPGCWLGATEYLRPFLGRFRHTLVVFDRDGCGSTKTRRQLQNEINAALATNGWQDRARAIVIAPELEIWVWGSWTNLATVLGSTESVLRELLTRQGLPTSDLDKPTDPKTALSTVIGRRHQSGRRNRRSPRLFGQLAANAPLNGCRDPAFRELRRTLRTWFPPPSRPSRQ